MATKTSRRAFLKGSAGAAGVFAIVPSYVLGGRGRGRKSPSDVITRGVIGTGGQGLGGHVTDNPEGRPPVTLAVCDVDSGRLARAAAKARGAKAYSDWRHVLDHKDIDTIHIATPPHWHALIAIAAAQAGKDVLCEKPMTRFIHEGRAVDGAIRRYGRVFQIGTYGRFGARQLRKLVAGGLLGEPLTVRVTRRTGYNWKVRQWSGRTRLVPQPVPANLDYDLWLGPAPYKPYHPHRVHGSFRGYWDYDGGGLADMGQHYLDPVQYWLGKDHTSPVKVEAHAPWPQHPDAVGMWGRVMHTYADGTRIILESGEWGTDQPGEHPFLEGPNGRIWKGRTGRKTDPAGLMAKLAAYPDPPAMIGFHQAVKTRKQPGGNAASSHRSATLLHLSNIAIRLGRSIRYDPVRQYIVGDAEANRLVNGPMRAPWHL